MPLYIHKQSHGIPKNELPQGRALEGFTIKNMTIYCGFDENQDPLLARLEQLSWQ